MRKSVWLAVAVVPVLGLAAASGLAQPEDSLSRDSVAGNFDPAQMIDRMMQQDANGDGKLSKEEMQGPQGERLFERADANKDGFVDRAELETAFANRGQPGGFGQAPGQGAPGAAMTFDAGMEQAGRAMRRLRRSDFNADSQAGDLAAIEQVQAGLLAAKQQLSEVDMSEAAKAKFGEDTAAYQTALRVSLANALKHAIDVELATASGQGSLAKAALAKLVESQEAGHELFQEEEEENQRSVTPRVRPARP